MASDSKKNAWGIWLKNSSEWAELSPRLRKPMKYNSDLVPALVDEMWRLIRLGHDPELKRIPGDELKAMREQHKETR